MERLLSMVSLASDVLLAATLSAHRLAAFGVHVLAALGGDDARLAAGVQAVPLPG
jgi:hypothetical protein